MDHSPAVKPHRPDTHSVDAAVPERRWRLITIGTLLLLGVYYVNYVGEFHEGTGDTSILAIAGRLLSVALIVSALGPFRPRASLVWLLVALYGVLAGSLLLGATFSSGGLNDALFFNTIIQLPILVALTITTRQFDFARWFNLFSWCLVVQGMLDTWVWFSGDSLWLSRAFVGGFGNPSAFGLACVVACAFNLFHPDAGRHRRPLAIGLGISAAMSMSLFSVLGLAFVLGVWTLRKRRRFTVGLLMVMLAGMAMTLWWRPAYEDETFVTHKLSAAMAFVGLIDYDVDSSLSVSLRSEIHKQTLAAILKQPIGIITGHLEGKAYWPMDSQLLTYLGSFGLICLMAFLLLHLAWIGHAFRNRRADGGFALMALLVFGGVFATNRILDYFPMAAIYFFCIASAMNARRIDPRST